MGYAVDVEAADQMDCTGHWARCHLKARPRQEGPRPAGRSCCSPQLEARSVSYQWEVSSLCPLSTRLSRVTAPTPAIPRLSAAPQAQKEKQVSS